MPGITAKRLDALQKTLEAVFSEEPEQLESLTKGIDGLRAAIAKGETVTTDDLSDILGEVVVEKTDGAAPAAPVADNAQDPLAPIFVGLFKSLFADDGTVRKGVAGRGAQELFQKAYEKALGELDGAIEGAVEATAIELNKARRSKKKPEADDKDGEGGDADGEDPEDVDGEDMEKLLKAAGVAPALVGKIAKMQSTIDALRVERDLERFTKEAEALGEGKEFGKTLMALNDADPKLAEDITKRLKAKNELLRKSDDWSREIGGGNAGEGSSALDQLNGHAREMVQKGESDAKGKKLTFAKAFTIACDRYPELYREYQRERDGRRAA